MVNTDTAVLSVSTNTHLEEENEYQLSQHHREALNESFMNLSVKFYISMSGKSKYTIKSLNTITM